MTEFDHANDPAVSFIIQGLIDDLHEMNDGGEPGSDEAPFGIYAQTEDEGNVLIVRPDPDEDNWGTDAEGERIEGWNGEAPTTPVVRITVERIA